MNYRSILNSLAVTFVLLLLLAGQACHKQFSAYHDAQTSDHYEGSVMDYLTSRPDAFDSLVVVIRYAGLEQVLKSDSVTFFAPTDGSVMAALQSYNIFRRSEGLPVLSLTDIDSSSWRSILTAYIINRPLHLSDFNNQDGLTMRTVGLRDMHGSVIRQNASGVLGAGVKTIQFSYPNGSRYTRDWLSADVSTSDIQATNGVINILENRHILGFNTFIDKARTRQNLYSEARVYASGTITLPNTDSRIWTHRVKALRAAGKDTVETEAFDSLAGGYLMRLVIEGNDSVKVLAAPGSVNQTIMRNGPCYFDPEKLVFHLDYMLRKEDGMYYISEVIQYTAQ